jgi:hypothetical protein
MPTARPVRVANGVIVQSLEDAMRAALLCSVPVILATIGCAHIAPAPDPQGLQILANTSVAVSVDRGQVAVFPEPAPFIGDSNGVIRWTLVLEPSDYVFPDDGIAFSGTAPAGKSLPPGCTGIGDPAPRFKNCKPNPARSAYQCSVTGNPHLPKNICYFYVVKLVRVAGSGPAELVLDPWAKPK